MKREVWVREISPYEAHVIVKIGRRELRVTDPYTGVDALKSAERAAKDVATIIASGRYGYKGLEK